MSELGVSKQVVLTVSRPCFSANSLVEVLRMAVGLSVGMVPHKVSLVFIGDGCVQALSTHGTQPCHKYFLSAKAHGVKIFVDTFSLTVRNLKDAELVEGAEKISVKDLKHELCEADIHLRV